MDPLVQDKLYTRLFRMWDRERTTPKILKIADNGGFLREISNLVTFLRTEVQKNSATNPTLQFIYQKTIKNIQYMISDILELRAEKLLQFAKENKPVDQNSVFDFEWQYYQQLAPAFKGYSKSTQRIIQDLTPKITQRKSENTLRSPVSVKTAAPTVGNPPLSSKSSSEIDETKQIPPISHSSIQTSSSQSENNSPSYVTILTLRSIPSFVGSDLKDYGPVAKGEIAMIPRQNALIYKEERLLRII